MWGDWGGEYDPLADEPGVSTADILNETTQIEGVSVNIIKRDLEKAMAEVFAAAEKKQPWSKISAPPADLTWHKPTCSFEKWTHTEVKVELSEGIVYITLNRPNDSNSLTGGIIAGLCDAVFLLHERRDLRVAVFTGEGKLFCGGGDGEGGNGFDLQNPVVKEMEPKAIAAGAFPSGNVSMGRLLMAKLWHVWSTVPQFTICLCQGSAMGDGIGCIGASDYTVAVTGSHFCLSDVKFGMTAANLGPYVVAKVGLASAKKIYCTGEILSAETARDYKLIDDVVPSLGDGHKKIKEICDRLTKAGPRTVEATKELVHGCSGRAMSEPLMFYTSEMQAKIQTAEECKQAASGKKPWTDKPIKPLK